MGSAKVRSIAFLAAAILLIMFTSLALGRGLQGSRDASRALGASGRRVSIGSPGCQSPHPTGPPFKNATYLCVLSRRGNVSAFKTYKVGNATVYVPEGVDLLFEWRAAAVASEMGAEELGQKMEILSELLRKEFEGNYSEGFRKGLEAAEKGQGASYLWDVVRWERRGLSNREMINETLTLIHGLIRNLSADRFREGALFVLYELSLERAYILASCDPPRVSFPTGWRYLYDFDRAGCLVWVGCYSSPTPQRSAFIGEACTTTYTTDMDYYWQEANRYCNSQLLKSIQIKWFHKSLALSPYNWRHDVIWEGNKNYTHEWYTYGEPYSTTNPPSGWYYIRHNYYYVLYCCYPPRYYCNTYCGDYCFACDEDATQHFVGRP